MSDVADDMMDEAMAWHDERETCPTCGKWYLPGYGPCPTCEDGSDELSQEDQLEHETETPETEQQQDELLPFPGAADRPNEVHMHPADAAEMGILVAAGVDVDESEAAYRERLLTELYETTGFQPTELSDADKAAMDCALDDVLQHIGILQAQIGHTATIAERKARVIQDWFEEQVAGPRRRIAFLEGEAKRIAEHIRPHTFGKKKSKDLPHGVVKFNQGKGSVVVDDVKKAVAFAKQKNIPVATVETVGKDDLREFIKSVGEDTFAKDHADKAGFRFEPGVEKFSLTARLPEPDA